jgi:hypothetical protein
MLYSQGIAIEDLGIGQKKMDEEEARRIWIRFDRGPRPGCTVRYDFALTRNLPSKKQM